MQDLGRGLQFTHLKAHKLCDKGGCFVPLFSCNFNAQMFTGSFIIISQLRRPIELKFSQVCYCMHYVEIHQVRTLVFDN